MRLLTIAFFMFLGISQPVAATTDLVGTFYETEEEEEKELGDFIKSVLKVINVWATPSFSENWTSSYKTDLGHFQLFIDTLTARSFFFLNTEMPSNISIKKLSEKEKYFRYESCNNKFTFYLVKYDDKVNIRNMEVDASDFDETPDTIPDACVRQREHFMSLSAKLPSSKQLLNELYELPEYFSEIARTSLLHRLDYIRNSVADWQALSSHPAVKFVNKVDNALYPRRSIKRPLKIESPPELTANPKKRRRRD